MDRFSNTLKVILGATLVAALVCLANYSISWYLGGILGKFPFRPDYLWSARSGWIFLIAFVFAAAGGWKSVERKR